MIARFIAIVGSNNAVTSPADQAGYLREWRDRYNGATPVVLRPGSTAEVSHILKLANDNGIAIVTQSGNTGLVGGQIPHPDGREIVVSLNRMTGIRDVDADAGTIVVEAGVTLANVQRIADDAGWMFPLSLASEGSACVGGILATNAGGTQVLAYGNARQLALGLEVVLADGRIWNGLRRLKKDNTGYDLRDLMIGSEGTLGIITAATLSLRAKPNDHATAILGFADPDRILHMFRHASAAFGSRLTGFEFWSRPVMEFAVTSDPDIRDPLTTEQPWYVLLEISSASPADAASEVLEAGLLAAPDNAQPCDSAIAQSMTQAKAFWTMRERFSEAQKIAGGSIKHDISVPVARIPMFLSQAAAVVERVCPGARPVPFGHFGDGNVHYNVSQPIGMDRDAYLALWEPMSEAIHGLVTELSGSISAEHGIGQMKRLALQSHKSSVELDMMRAIKQALDPNGILNPGKVL